MTAAAVTGLATSSLVACSGSGGVGSSGAGSSSELNIISAEPTSGLDPNTAVTQTSLRVMELMYDTLIDYDAKGGLVPDLATKWAPSANGKSYTFSLRKGAKFSDGSAITATDVKFSLERAAKGQALKTALSDMTSVNVLDPSTVKVNLKSPSRVFLNALARVGNAAILSQKAVTANTSYFTKPTATSGPWSLQQWTPQSNLGLTANTFYWRTGFPKIKTINYAFSSDGTTEASALQAGTADMTYPMAPEDALRLQKAGAINYYPTPTPGVVMWGLDKTKPPFNDVRARQAVAYMAPRADKQSACWSNIGANATGNLIFNGNWAYTPGLNKYGVSQSDALAKAGALLDAAGWKMGSGGVRQAEGVKGVANGTKFAVTVPYENAWTQARCNTQLLQSDLKPLGVQITPQAYDTATFYPDVAKNKFQMYHAGDQWATVDDEMSQAFTCNGQATNLIAKWCDPQVDDLIAKAQATLDLTKAKQYYAQVQQIVEDQVPAIVTGNQYAVVGLATRVHGYVARADGSNRSLIEATLG
ncbi:ABC transporter substrate-binding protein [Actinacidiphila oryziradicis]|nr:ABC transporter substrate-binding protein [Actinacidiphila oryziradicis]